MIYANLAMGGAEYQLNLLKINFNIIKIFFSDIKKDLKIIKNRNICNRKSGFLIRDISD